MSIQKLSVFVLSSALAAGTVLSSCGSAVSSASSAVSSVSSEPSKTTFQSSRAWMPEIDNRADAVMIYGVGGNPSDKSRRMSLEERISSWKDRGYTTDFMTGIAWGEYQDYFTGQWDGKWHLDEGQVQADGDTIWHGHLVPYIVPTENYLKYFKEKHIKRVIDAGITSIYLEEPEFWARAGYSEAFKREWKAYYGTDWRPQDESPEATYLSSKLKYHLYYRALNEAFTYAKEYGRSKGLDIKCYVPTHSLLNYSQWQIVSPEASLASLPCVDGYIAQVWTGTSREPDYYNGVLKERVFETAYLEYGCMSSMTAPTGRTVWFLTDPIEDRARDWEDYKRNYHATFVAQLLYPQINTYEIMPWPERIYTGLYRKSPDSDERIRIPQDYATMMQIMTNALQQMPCSSNKLSGTHGIGVMMSNSLMFQRFPTHDGYDDPQLANFYGLAMPLVKHGIPAEIVHMENLGFKKTLENVKVLLMTYSNMKPMDKVSHKYLADWVRKGGKLIYAGRDNDPFQSVSEWWNNDGNDFKAPSDHLFSLMGISAGAEGGLYKYGKGEVMIIRQDPKEFVLNRDGAAVLMDAVRTLFPGEVEIKNNFILERGPYTLAAVLDENPGGRPIIKTGKYVNLFDPKLPVMSGVIIAPGNQGFFFDLSKVDNYKPMIIASAARSYDENTGKDFFSYTAKAPANTVNVSRILLPAEPKSVTVNGTEVFDETSWDAASNTYRITFDNDPDGVSVRFQW